MSGDANCDGRLTEADVAVLTQRLFADLQPPCPDADANRDGMLTAPDLTALIQALRPGGPTISFFGVTGSDGRATSPLGTLPDGTPVYFRSSGFGFQLVVEARPGRGAIRVGTKVLDSAPNDPTRRPDLQIQVNRPLGDGNRTVCDELGVPAIEPPDFSVKQTISDALNDLGCRFSVATARAATCTLDEFDQANFRAAESTTQFCLRVDRNLAFPTGESIVTVRVRDTSGVIGPPRQLRVRVESGPMPPTYTPVPATFTRTTTPTRTPTATRTASRPATQTRTATRTATSTLVPTRTSSATATVTSTRASTGTPTLTRVPTSTRTGQPSLTATVFVTPTRTFTDVPGATRTRTPTLTRTPTRTPEATRTSTSARISTATRTTGVTATRTATRTLTRTPTVATPETPTRTRTGAATPTPTPTPDAAMGPSILHFGLLRPDDTLLEPSGFDPGSGAPIYERPFGFGFSILVEARPGSSGRPVARSSFNEFGRPDLQIQTTRALGNGSPAVCDVLPPDPGGVPGINPPSFGDSQVVSDRLNDLGCRFIDGSGNPNGRNCSEGCVRFESGDFGCVEGTATIQFCGLVARTIEFPPGDTRVTVRARDTQGNLGLPAQLIVRIAQ